MLIKGGAVGLAEKTMLSDRTFETKPTAYDDGKCIQPVIMYLTPEFKTLAW